MNLAELELPIYVEISVPNMIVKGFMYFYGTGKEADIANTKEGVPVESFWELACTNNDRVIFINDEKFGGEDVAIVESKITSIVLKPKKDYPELYV
jgi:hypothetical protein